MVDTQHKNIEIGYGRARGGNAFETGKNAALRAATMIRNPPPVAVLVFASVRYDLNRVLGGVRSVISGAPLFGCTTAGEICNEPLQESVVVTILASTYMKVSCGLGRKVSGNWRLALQDAINAPAIKPYFHDASHWRSLTLEGKSAFAILFSPGNTRANTSLSYEILEAIRRKSLGRLPVFGGSAADDWRMERNFVFLGEEAYPDSMVLAIVETQLQFGIAMEHGFAPTSHQMTATRCEGHEIIEMDGATAAEAYARLVGFGRNDLEGKHLTLTTGHAIATADPLNQFNINVASYFTPRGGINVSHPVAPGTVLTLMEPERDTMRFAGREALRKAIMRGSIASPALSMVAYCALRPRLMGSRSQEEIRIMAETGSGCPLTGFFSFGEQGISDGGSARHNNAVVSTLVLGNDLSPLASVALENEKLRRQQECQTEDLLKTNQELRLEIAERMRTVQLLRVSEGKYRAILENGMVGIWLVDVQGRLMEVNRTYCRMSGYGYDELLTMSITDLEHQETAEDTASHIKSVMARGTDRFESRHRRKNGTVFDVEISAQFLPDSGGWFVAFVQDITERTQAETERRQLEAELHQAQKMESVGRLAGGVAHDFNNMLSVIIGHAELGLRKTDPASPLGHNLTEIRKAGGRSANLTRQLLAFARKQAIMPRALDLNETVGTLLDMLRRLIGTNISLVWLPKENIWTTMADPSQIDQITVNLCLNSRDAIARTGVITIETGNCVFTAQHCAAYAGFKAGEFVRLTVSDDGCGMEKETQELIFEPFFTTKEQGKGTGLGLAMVYGIVQQNDGFIDVRSEPDRGTRVSVYLPRHTGTPRHEWKTTSHVTTLNGGETILLVEDDPSILKMISSMLEMHGYTVLATSSPGEAIYLADVHGGDIHLLLTDVVMPEMNGRELAERLLALFPGLTCLFMSGYTSDIITHRGEAENSIHFIQKPFSIPDLAVKVRKALDNG